VNSPEGSVRRVKPILLLLMMATLAACGGNAPAPTNTPAVQGTRGPLPTLNPVVWRKAGSAVTLVNAARIELLGTLIKHEASVNQIDFSPDSRGMLTLDGVGTGHLWDTETGANRFTFAETSALYAAFNADGSQVISAMTDGTLQFLTTADGLIASNVQANSGGVLAMAISADRTRLATGGPRGDILIWDVATRGIVHRIDLKRPIGIVALVFSRDGKLLASATSDQVLHTWAVESGTQTAINAQLPTPLNRLLFTPDGTLLLAASERVVYALATTTLETRWQITGRDQDSGAGMAISPDSQLLALGSTGETLTVWSLLTGKEQVVLLEQQRTGSSLEFSPNGELLLNTLLLANQGSFVWSVASFLDDDPKVQGKNFNPSLNGILLGAWSPDGRYIVLADGSGGLYVWGMPA
jgi:WD40 repeat protein